MSIRFYDEAIAMKIKSWVKDTELTILKPDEVSRMLQIKADQNNDNPISLPLIMISRDTRVEILDTSRKPLTYDGMLLDSDGKSTLELNAVPIQLNYQIDIFTRHFDECDEYVRQFVFQLINKPKVKIVLPYNNKNIEQIASIRLIPTIQDNSDIPQRLFPDQFTRMTLEITLDNAYLYSIPIKEVISIDSEVIVKDKN